MSGRQSYITDPARGRTPRGAGCRCDAMPEGREGIGTARGAALERRCNRRASRWLPRICRALRASCMPCFRPPCRENESWRRAVEDRVSQSSDTGMNPKRAASSSSCAVIRGAKFPFDPPTVLETLRADDRCCGDHHGRKVRPRVTERNPPTSHAAQRVAEAVSLRYPPERIGALARNVEGGNFIYCHSFPHKPR